MNKKSELESIKKYNAPIHEFEKNKIEVKTEIDVRYVLGNPGNNILAILAMNPSTATDKDSDSTINIILAFIEELNSSIEEINKKIDTYNSIIDQICVDIPKKIIKIQKIDGWIVFNLYPEKNTNPYDLSTFHEDIFDNNLQYIKFYIQQFNIKQVWLAWGNVKGETLLKSKKDVLEYLFEMKKELKYYTFFNKLTKNINPIHPQMMQRNKQNLCGNQKIYEKNTIEISKIETSKQNEKNQYSLKLLERDSKNIDTLIGELDEIDNIQQYIKEYHNELINIIESLNKKIEEYNLNYNPKYEK